MAEKKKPNLEDDLKLAMDTTKSYVARSLDTSYAAVKAANEAIDYKFEDLKSGSQAEKLYIKTLHEVPRDFIKKELGISGDYNEKLLDQVMQEMGHLTYKQISEFVKQRGTKINSEELLRVMVQNNERFAEQHYFGSAQKYISKKEHVEAAIKYLGKEDSIDAKKASPADLQQLVVSKHVRGELRDRDIPLAIRKKGDDDEELDEAA